MAVLPLIYRPSQEPYTLLVAQFRPPVGQCTIELPAGLVDEGEEGNSGAARAALRELHEETGYGVESSGSKVNVQMVSGTMANDPGLTGANMKLCIVRIDLDQDAPDPIAQPDEGEFIEKHLLPLRELHSHIKGTR